MLYTLLIWSHLNFCDYWLCDETSKSNTSFSFSPKMHFFGFYLKVWTAFWIIMSILQHTKPNISLERLTTLVLENMVIRLIDSFTMMFDRSKSGILTSHKDGIFASFSTRSIRTTKKANRKDNADKDWD